MIYRTGHADLHGRHLMHIVQTDSQPIQNINIRAGGSTLRSYVQEIMLHIKNIF